MNTYYFDNSIWVHEREIVVITENAFRKMQDNLLSGWDHHWLNTDARTLSEARAIFIESWCS